MTPARRTRLLGPAIAAVLVLVPTAGALAVVAGFDRSTISPEDAGLAAPAATAGSVAEAPPRRPDAPAGTDLQGAAQQQARLGEEAQAPAAGDPFMPSAAWVERTAAATGIPARALVAYARAHLRVAAEQPGCQVAWNTIAALGGIESQHGSIGGAVLGPDGRATPVIRGPELSGGRFGVVRDTDGGSLDGDPKWDRAVGPMQFIPSTWERWAADGNGDGVADPDQIDDAALASTRYLCAAGNLRDPETWRRAIFSYNHSDVYVADIASYANVYAQRAAR
ncbi:lytic transglycosylase domain-containing protein [Nocardioides sp.]|uniref:lytic transglycosylase domain-containing protein n=1 Tax=Nocardioides sp. TaxID=35761 RepID=UPI0035177354